MNSSAQWRSLRIFWNAAILLLALERIAGAENPYFVIQVVDDQTGRGVPLVELETVHRLRCETDSNGIVSFDEPGLMGQEIFFQARSHGYEFPKDGFGYAGVRLKAVKGGKEVIRIHRRNIAERLYRITGAGIYRDSVRAGESVPIREPLLNAQVIGQDSVMAVPYRGKIYWFWGDTNLPRYPLGLFHVSGAISDLPAKGGLDPSAGVDLKYFVDRNGTARDLCPMEGKGPVWIEGLLTIQDLEGKEWLVARYTRMKDLSEMLEHGLARFDDQKEVFEKWTTFDLKERWRCPRGHPFRVHDKSDGDWFYFPTPFATVRVKAGLESLRDPSAYEAFTCLVSGSRYQDGKPRVERNGKGELIYAWKADADPIGVEEERKLIEAGVIRLEEARYQPRDLDDGKPVFFHAGSIQWNAFRKKWIMIAEEKGGSSFLGEIWFAESDSMTGPWRWARKIVTHERYSFYNPTQHPFFDQEEGRLIYFEGTYASTFSGNLQQTPRYDYNQILYRLDLGDPRLKSPTGDNSAE